MTLLIIVVQLGFIMLGADGRAIDVRNGRVIRDDAEKVTWMKCCNAAMAMAGQSPPCEGDRQMITPTEILARFGLSVPPEAAPDLQKVAVNFQKYLRDNCPDATIVGYMAGFRRDGVDGRALPYLYKTGDAAVEPRWLNRQMIVTGVDTTFSSKEDLWVHGEMQEAASDSLEAFVSRDPAKARDPVHMRDAIVRTIRHVSDLSPKVGGVIQVLTIRPDGQVDAWRSEH